MIIGLTGGIASGKSTATKILKEQGAKIIDADVIARQILARGQPGWWQVKEKFGAHILDEEGEINRSLLGDIVFSNPDQRRKLEEITHPLIMEEIEKKLNQYNAEDDHIVLVAPLLYETGLDKKVDEVWVVYVDRFTQLERLQKRDSLSLREARQRIETQLPIDKKKEWADRVLDNRHSRAILRQQLEEYWEQL